MSARLHLLGVFKKYQPSDPWEIEPDDQSVELLLKKAGMNLNAGYVLLVNGSRKKKSYVPRNGDDIKILPLIVGG